MTTPIIELAETAAWNELLLQSGAGLRVDPSDGEIAGTVKMRAVVRAVLEAISHPSEAMMVAGAGHTTSFAQPGIVRISTDPSEPKVGAGKIFSAMIDAALEEG